MAHRRLTFVVFFLFATSRAGAMPIDLADIVGGGDGTGTGGSQGIDPRNGNVATVQATNLTGVSVNTYQAVAANPFVDGVVIPNGGPSMLTPVPVSGTLSVTGIPETDNRTYDHIWNGINLGIVTSLTFNSALGIHANKGITFDLDAIEAANPLQVANHFSSRFAMGLDATTGGFGNASMFVIVDGVIKASANLATANADIPVNVPLAASDRFLTLLATSDGPNHSDQTMFLDPIVTLVPEPAAVVLALSAGLFVVGIRRRQR